MKNNWIRDTLRGFTPYKVAPIAETHVINANENYLNVLSIPSIKEELLQRMESWQPSVYPKPMADELRETLADYMNLQPENIIAGNGGDEMITYFLGTFLNPGDRILVHAPTFDMYQLGAETLGASAITVKDLPGYRRDREGLLKAVRTYQPKVTILCNPNNPTGELLPKSYIEEVVQAADNLVLVDEAYMEFAADESVISLISKYDNLVVLRTLSKCFALAGLRCGYLAAQKELIDAICRIKAPYNLNTFTQLMAVTVLHHREEIFKVRDNIVSERRRMIKALEEIPEITVYPSETNFILLLAGEKQERIFEALRQADILVKIYRNNPLIPGGFRITITTPEINDRVIAIIRREVGHA